MDQDSALAYLTAVVSDLLSTGNDYFLPIEAVEEVVKELRKPENSRDLIEAVEQVALERFPEVQLRLRAGAQRHQTSIHRTKKRSNKSSRAASNQ